MRYAHLQNLQANFVYQGQSQGQEQKTRQRKKTMPQPPIQVLDQAVDRVVQACISVCLRYTSALYTLYTSVAGPAIWNWLPDSLRDPAISRLLQAFTEDVFYFQLTRVHSAFLDDALYKFTYLLTHSLTYLLTYFISSE